MSSSGDTTLFDILRKRTKRQVGFSIGQRWDQKTKDDPFLRDAVFCADLVFGNGKTYRVSTRPITVYDNNEMIPYIPMLVNDPSVKNTYDFKGGSASQRSVKIDIDARLLDPLDIILNGSFLMGVGEISLQVDGEQFEDRFVLMRGDMKGGITFGAKEEVLSLSIGDLKLSVDKIIPKAVTDKRGFPTCPDDQLGFRFPLPLTDCRFIPAIKLSANDYGPTFLCCYGTDHNISEIYLDGESVPATVTYNVANMVWIAINWTQVSGEDDQGNPWTGITFQTQNVPAFKDKGVYSSMVSKKGQSSSVIDVIERLLTDHTASAGLQYDRVLHAKAVAKAGGSLFGSLCVNGSDEQNTATVLSYIEGSICKEFAMLKPVYTGQGYGIVLTDRTSSLTRLELVRGQGLLIDRVSAITESPAQGIFNRFTIRYNFNALTNNYADVIVRNPQNSKLCRMSNALLGDREMKPIDSLLIKDDETASALIDWYVNHYTLPTYTVQYCATPRLFFVAQIGDNVFLTDEKIGFNRVSATIKGLELKDGKCIVDFQIWLQYEGIQ